MKEIKLQIPNNAEIIVKILDKGNITDKIKTFEDAYSYLGSEHIYCKTWDSIYTGNDEDLKDVLAYYKLRIIALALNEGWQPKFTRNEYCYYPWFKLINNSISFTYISVGTSLIYTNVGSRIIFKSRELAEYAGRQFINIYKDFLYE